MVEHQIGSSRPEVAKEVTELPSRTREQRRLLAALEQDVPIHGPNREFFDHQFELAVNSLLNKDQQTAVHAAADMLLWRWFGGADQPLPDSVALFFGSENRLIYNPKSSIGVANPSAEQYLKSWIGNKEPERSGLFKGAALESYISAMPMHNFLRSFLVEAPVIQELRLSDQERLARERQIEADVRHRYGMADGKPFERYTPAWKELQRHFYLLDEETSPRLDRKPSDPKAKFEAWLLAEAQSRWSSQHPSWYPNTGGPPEVKIIGLASITQDYSDFDMALRADSFQLSNGETLPFNSVMNGFMDDQYETGPYTIPRLDAGLLEDFSANLLLKNMQYKQALAAAVHSVTERYLYFNNGQLDDSLLIAIRRPRGDIYTELPESYLRHNTLAIDKPQSNDVLVVSRERYSQDIHSTIGDVLYRSRPQDAARLVDFQTFERVRQLPLPKSDKLQDYDLVLQFDPKMELAVNDAKPRDGHGREPYIAGFDLVATDGDKWYFNRSELDPYEGSGQIKLEKNGIDLLRQKYSANGMTALAQALQGIETMSAADLASIIRQHSDYTFDTSLPEFSKITSGMMVSIGAFTQFVRDGRVQMQCAGAATFLGYSLEIALEGSTAVQSDGWLMTDSARLTAVRHAQTLLIYQGRQFLLDATPNADAAGGRSLDITGNFGRGRFGRRRSTAQAHREIENHPQLPHVATESPAEEIEIEPPKTADLSELLAEHEPQRIEACKERVEQILSAVLDIPKQNLAEDLIKLSRDDPVYRAYEALHKKPPVGTRADQIAAAAEYIESYVKKGDAGWRKRHGVPLYNPDFMHLLRQALL